MQGSSPSRIEAGRNRAATAKNVLAVAAVGLFGAAFLLVRSGNAAQTQPQAAATAVESDDFQGTLGGGSVAPSAPTQSFPQARTGMS